MALVYALAILAAAALGFLVWRGARIWKDSGDAGWALQGAIVPSRYWWGARLEATSPQEREDLVLREIEALGLSHADSEKCPLCGAEIPQAWKLDQEGKPTVAPGSVECPECDFRLDSCRHCKHFLPGEPLSWSLLGGSGGGDITSGRCGFYKRSQPVEEAAAPEMARRLKERGYDQVRAPMPIKDSMLRPDFCRAFDPHPKRIAASGVSWPGPRRAGLLRLMAADSGHQGRRDKDTEEGKWLL